MTMFKDRVIVITGAARGLGLVIAKACARQNANLILADVLTELGEQEAGRLADEGANVRFIALDLEDPASVESFAANIREREGVVHGLVNNAALAVNVGGVSFEDTSIELWDRLMRINARGTWLVTRALTPLMSGEVNSRIVNIASDTAIWGAPRLAAYVASKGAVIAMTRTMARDLGARRIGIAAVAPGITRTEASVSAAPGGHEIYETRRAVPGPQYPGDIVDAITFLLTPGALALTGQVLPVNAGFVYT